MDKSKTTKIILRVVLSVLTVAFIAWIFSNSLKVATESAEQSGSLVEKIQAFFKAIAPTSFIATAEGEDLKWLEEVIRTMAHFAEFALLGALCFWTYRAYTDKKIWMIAPFTLSAVVAVTDEILQYFTPGRAFEWTDVLVDTSGAVAGCLFALFAVWLVAKIIKKSQAKKQKETEKTDE